MRVAGGRVAAGPAYGLARAPPSAEGVHVFRSRDIWVTSSCFAGEHEACLYSWRVSTLSTPVSPRRTRAGPSAGLGSDDLLFQLRQDPIVAELEDAAKEQEDHGRTELNAAGRTYRHGTLSGYSAGKCHCEHCRKAYADYRARRRAEGKDAPRPGPAGRHRRAHPPGLVP
jgi:hypothetical protein